MTWFSFPGGWGDYNLNGLSEKEMAATGAHGYATQALADAHVNKSPSTAQAALLTQFKTESLSPVGAGSAGVLSTPNGTGGISGAASNVVNDALKPLFNKNIWLRVGEVVVGLILLGIGLNALLKGKPMTIVTKTAGLASKVVPA